MVNIALWKDFLDEGISLAFLIALGLTFYRGFKRNHTLLWERENLLKRYLLFRGDKQVTLKAIREDAKAYQELIKTISNSWKTFKKASDQYLTSFAQNTARTKFFLQIITAGLVINSLRNFFSDYFLFGLQIHLFYTLMRELSSYVPVILCFGLLRVQTRPFLPLRVKTVEMDREVLFFPNGQPEGESEHLYNEFDPLDRSGGDDGKENQDSDRRIEH
jgi:hypothetical protein